MTKKLKIVLYSSPVAKRTKPRNHFSMVGETNKRSGWMSLKKRQPDTDKNMKMEKIRYSYSFFEKARFAKKIGYTPNS